MTTLPCEDASLPTIDPSLCNGMYYDRDLKQTRYCTEPRAHEGNHGDAAGKWGGMFHFEGNVCQICGDEPSSDPGNPRLRVGQQWVHIECDWDLRDELAQEWADPD